MSANSHEKRSDRVFLISGIVIMIALVVGLAAWRVPWRPRKNVITNIKGDVRFMADGTTQYAIEYNATLRPPMSLAVPYDPDGAWDGTNFHGASLEALTRLGAAKGYRLVGCCMAGGNAFFVRADLTGDLFLEPPTAAEHYEPPRHYLHLLPAGHKSRPGPFVSV